MKKPSLALIVALIALLIAVSGTTYAAVKLPKNSVGSKQVKNSSLKAKDLRKGVLGERSNVYYGVQDGFADLMPDEIDTPIVTLEGLPAGSYLLTGHLTAVKFGTPPSIVRCGIKAAGTNSMGAQGNGFAAAVGGGDGAIVVPVQASLAVSSASAFDAQLYCRQDGLAADVEEGRLIAERVDSVAVRISP